MKTVEIVCSSLAVSLGVESLSTSWIMLTEQSAADFIRIHSIRIREPVVVCYGTSKENYGKERKKLFPYLTTCVPKLKWKVSIMN